MTRSPVIDEMILPADDSVIRLPVTGSSCLPADDSMSAASVSDVNDRLSALELRVQQQEDELTVMKAALADVLRRLAASEDASAAVAKKQHGGKGNICLSNSTLILTWFRIINHFFYRWRRDARSLLHVLYHQRRDTGTKT